ncbi:putative DCC family thiol-disulfide oxidoreductase YuxK [Nocardioides cavernae]|uniref:Putative DCC family thiol-disulfide oxidoreductase YuxK n=1 Tax=Nocardioides cavernae TaxID=1921566 RepID=A0A7Y9H2T3_9ACTN|nr:DUF393 domain-containing protein [Nocardioides cavernae]NYE36887.1 putative DCC family thiol-disulfide oxidoreductase YuxK [Nocardioides cavernae]
MRLTVLYDDGCPLCRTFSGWLARQPVLVPLDLVPAGSDAARQRFPRLDHGPARAPTRAARRDGVS